MKLIIDDKIPFIRGEAEKLGDVIYKSGVAISAADVRDADALIVRTRTRCDRSLLEGSSVKFIATATIGYDHIDTDYCRRAGIEWANCPGCNATSVAQYVECCLLLLAAKERMKITRNTVMGIVGVGHVGTQVALMARRLGLRLLLCDPLRLEGRGGVRTGEAAAGGITDRECCATLEDICREADIVTFHTPLTTTGLHATYHLADKSFFEALERKPVFINAGRGEVMDTNALLAALKEGLVSEAVIDTWENEPHLDLDLLERAFIATPHIAGYSADGKAKGTQMALEAVAEFFGRSLRFDISPQSVSPDFRYFAAAPDGLSESYPQLALYDPRRDSFVLKAQPSDFERLRGNYPLRREFEGV